MLNKNEILDKILNLALEEINNNPTFSTDSFQSLKNKIYSSYHTQKPFPNIELINRYNTLIKEGKLIENEFLKKILRKRLVRSQSGVTVISLLTKPFPCTGKCIYCPDFKELPKSYIPNEPAVMRASLNQFDPIKQIHNRLRALEITGHNIEKNDVRIIGGTWSNYPLLYQEEFIKGIYDAFNTYDDMKEYIEATELEGERFATFKVNEKYKEKLSKDLEEAKKKNETNRLRVIGIAIETRPDYINVEEIIRLRKYGVTRVEIGYQTTFDEINKLNKRGHGNKESIEATRLLKDAGFKVVAHMMPNLLGSNPEKDLQSLKEIFDNPDFRPDELKIYPMIVTDNSELTKIWREGKFTPYDDKTLVELTTKLESIIPEYVRLNRTYRDIPASEILAGSHLANLRQIVEEKLREEDVEILEIRHREIKFGENDPHKAIINDYTYEASGGIEHFLSFEDPNDRKIFSLLRLRIPKGNTAIIRELHTFGKTISIGEKGDTQHIGFGKRLLEEAEKIAKNVGMSKIIVIAGVGVREYYKKRGYELEGEYMCKNL